MLIEKQRSLQQNKYYWSVVIPLLCPQLWTKKEVHKLLKRKFLNVKSSTELSTLDFQQYLIQIYIWAYLKLQISIPDPDGNILKFYPQKHYV